MNFAVLTAAIGPNTDRIKAPLTHNPHVRYIAFASPENKVPAPWERVDVLPTADTSPTLTARTLKILAHKMVPELDYSLWIDAAFELQCDPAGLLTYFAPSTQVMAFRHPDRTNIIQEGAELVRLGIVPELQIALQVTRMGGFSTGQRNLTATGFLLRRHDMFTQAWCESWNDQFILGGHLRDQMSVDYSARQAGIEIHYFPGNYRDNRFSKWHAHRR